MGVMYMIEVEFFMEEKKRAYNGKMILPHIRGLEPSLNDKIEEGILSVMDIAFMLRKDLPPFKGSVIIVIDREPHVSINISCEKNNKRVVEEFMGLLAALVYTVHNIVASTVSRVCGETYWNGKRGKIDA